MEARNAANPRWTFYALLIFLSVLWGCYGSGEPGDGSVTLDGPSVTLESTYVASVATPGYRERAVMSQGQGEYAGVDEWGNSDPIPAGARLANGATSNLFSLDFSDRSTVAYSNYFTSEATLRDAMSGDWLDAAFFNGRVEVGPWRAEGATGHFTYRRFGAVYEVVRPLPVAYSVCRNNPQMDTAGAGGAPQYFAPFIRQDLIRLGYVRIVDAVDSTEASRTSTLARYTALYGRTAGADELAALAFADYTAFVALRTPPEQARAEALRVESTALRTEKKRSDSAFSATAFAGDVTIPAGRRIDGFARVSLAAPRDIRLSGTIWGADQVFSSAGGHCSVDEGGLVEVWTDRNRAGDVALSLACGTIEVGGRVQTQAAPWSSWSQGVPGQISLASANDEPSETGISIAGSGQVLALLQTAQTDASLSAVRITSPGSGIVIDGPGYGFNVVADKGAVHIENSGANGSVTILGRAAVSADVVRAGAPGDYGTLSISAGANLDANTLVKLFGGLGSGGKVVFRGAGDVILTSGPGESPIVISADAVEVETATRLVTRGWIKTGSVWSRTAVAADVYCNRCNWSQASGGDSAYGLEGTWTTPPRRAGPPPADRSFD
ncbi:MAG TPA: hypothetical protein PLR47_01700 [Smithellaceae bacterium]|nr:hypothetical protein [Smithellaceae bacterium]HOQ71586.1 hypothetical protein [Smithellaceae bacterium]